MAKMFKLLSCDLDFFDVPEKVAKKSQSLAMMLENPAFKDWRTFPVPKVRSVILAKVIEWATHHQDDDTTSCAKGVIDPWDKKFLNAQIGNTLFELILAADILDIQLLLDITCKTTAEILSTHNVQEIRKIFDIPGYDC